MARQTKSRPPKVRQTQYPKRRATRPRPPWWLYGSAAVGLLGLAAALALITFRSGEGSSGGSSSGHEASAGLPDTPDYHSLLVNPRNPRKLVLGTHVGLYISSDGGRHWRFDALSGDDAMNLARPAGKTVWLAGHNVFKKSSDGGSAWSDVRPSGLPGLDIHGFAVDPGNPKTLYAAVAGQGLYRSRDGGESFSLVSRQVGGNVMALAVLPGGRILAGDMQRGLVESPDGGASWKQRLRAQLIGLAVNPSDPKRILATGAGIALSTNGGRTWRSVLDLTDGAGPVAWSTSDPKLAYAVGFNRNLYRSTDRGASWQPVEGS
ncbi:MAG: YCF48-related protein [Actinomycetota bacterium]|nr:YCF48-related protein [Actinomycetota bacterium]